MKQNKQKYLHVILVVLILMFGVIGLSLLYNEWLDNYDFIKYQETSPEFPENRIFKKITFFSVIGLIGFIEFVLIRKIRND